MRRLIMLAALAGLCSGLTSDVAAHGRKGTAQRSRPSVGQPADRSAFLPGARGPRVEYLGNPPVWIDIIDVFVYERPEQAAEGVPRPQRFPAGTAKLTLDIRLREIPPPGTKIRYEVFTTTGTIEMAEGYVSIAYLATQRVASVDLDLRPGSGPFPDGPYRLRLFIDDVAVALLNWSVGGASSPAGPPETKSPEPRG